MLFSLCIKSLRRAKARFLCAVAGIAIASGAVVFTTSLVATNDAQAPLIAARASTPWQAWRESVGRDALKGDLSLDTIRLTVDYRPGGRVLQGPPMRAILSPAPESGNPYAAVMLVDGEWIDAQSEEPQIVCVKNALRRFGAAAPALGETLKFVGAKGTMSSRIVGYIDGAKLPPGFPTVFANPAAFKLLATEEHRRMDFFLAPPGGLSSEASFSTPRSEEVVAAYKSDEQRRMDYARPLMLVAAILTALSLLVNSLLLSVESNRRQLAVLRMLGMGKSGVVRFVGLEALLSAFAGWVLGTGAAWCAISLYAQLERTAFPAGAVFDVRSAFMTLAVLPVVVAFAVLFVLAPALRVRALDLRSIAPRSRRCGMVVTFALGFAAFVAVEVWGASLMRAFVPSPEWPDAIVSLLPGGVSSFDIEKLRNVDGVKRISELLPLQVPLKAAAAGAGIAKVLPPEQSGEKGARGPRMRGGPNALMLAAEWLPQFQFVEGDWQTAACDMRKGDSVVITDMMSRALNLHKGDALELIIGRPPRIETIALPIAGVVDLNWHMVTSRGLVRGLNGMPVMTSGPVFASFDTVESLDMRPAQMVKMTHLWVEYDEAFLASNGVFAAGRKIEAEIARLLGNPSEVTVRLHARDEIADGTLAHGSNVIGAAARVPFVFLAILSIGFIAMLVAEFDAKRKEFAILRMVGATRVQIATRLVASAVKTAFFGIVIGLPTGALTGWGASFKTASFWPGLPHWFVVPWPVVIEGAVGAVVFALLFAVPVSLKLAGRNRP